MARFASLLYFRKIYMLNVENVPKKGPLLLVCNHPSSFFEACLLAVLLPRPLYFLTRGDFFKKPMFSWFLRQTHQIPIFRTQDGFDKLRNNQDTFAYCYQALSENKAILIFPESWTVMEKRLRPLQKGAARLALGALKQISALNILPVGMTFSNPTKFRGLVTIKCGKPMPIIPPKELTDERIAMSEITNQILTALRSLMVHIDRPERELLYDAAHELVFNSEGISTYPVISASDTFPAEEIRLAEHINALSDEAEGLLSEKIRKYESALSQHQTTDRFLLRTSNLPGIARIFLILALPFFILGKIIYAIPTSLITRFLDARIHNPPFYGPVKWALGLYGLGFWTLICLLLGYLIGGLTGLLIAFTWLLSGLYTLRHFHRISLRGFLSTLTMTKATRDTLVSMRRAIVDSL